MKRVFQKTVSRTVLPPDPPVFTAMSVAPPGAGGPQGGPPRPPYGGPPGAGAPPPRYPGAPLGAVAAPVGAPVGGPGSPMRPPFNAGAGGPPPPGAPGGMPPRPGQMVNLPHRQVGFYLSPLQITMDHSGLFLDILKKTQARKNSKLKQILMKTQAKFQKNSKIANST